MLVYVAAIVVAILIVPLTGGRFDQLVKIRVRRSWMLFAGLILQVALELVDLPRARYDDVGLTILLASYVLIIGFGLSNLLITGMGVITIGIALNVFAIALNQGMPYRAPEGEHVERTVKHHEEGPDDILPELGDYIVLGSPVDASISFGDLIISVGLVDLTFRASRRPRRSRTRSREDDPVDTDTDTAAEVAAVPEVDTEIDLASAAAPAASPDAAPGRQAETEAGSGWTVDPATRSSASSTRGS